MIAHAEPATLATKVLDALGPGIDAIKGAVSPKRQNLVLVQLTVGPEQKKDQFGGPRVGFEVEAEAVPDDVSYVIIHHEEKRLWFQVFSSEAASPGRLRHTLFHPTLLSHGTAEDRGDVEAYEQLVHLRPDAYGVPLADEATPAGERLVAVEFHPDGTGERTATDLLGETAGITPWNARVFEATDRQYWWGVCIVIGGGPDVQLDSFIERKTHSIVHEMVHSLGLQHLCGHYDLRTPRRTTCACNYAVHALWADLEHKALAPMGPPRDLAVSGAPIGNRLCGHHIHELRRMRFHLHPGFEWRQ